MEPMFEKSRPSSTNPYLVSLIVITTALLLLGLILLAAGKPGAWDEDPVMLMASGWMINTGALALIVTLAASAIAWAVNGGIQRGGMTIAEFERRQAERRIQEG